MTNLQIIDYSAKAIAVIGDTKAIKDSLKNIGGRFNARLSCGAGWIFPKAKEGEITALIGGEVVSITVNKKEPETVKYKAITEITERAEQLAELAKFYCEGANVSEYLKGNRFFRLSGGEVIRLNDYQPKPKREILFDDETEEIQINEQNFIDYNMRFADFFECDTNNRIFVVLERGAYFLKNNLGRAMDCDAYRALADSEVLDLKLIFDAQKEAYIKRLKAYYAKYKDKIYARGYYANR